MSENEMDRPMRLAKLHCTHENTEPVEVGVGPANPFDPFDLFGVGIPIVTQVCVDCHEQLPAWWGCGDCETAEGERKVSESVPTSYLIRPCRRHQETL